MQAANHSALAGTADANAQSTIVTTRATRQPSRFASVVSRVVRLSEVDRVPVVREIPRAQRQSGNAGERFFRFGVAFRRGDVERRFSFERAADQVGKHGAAAAVRSSQKKIGVGHDLRFVFSARAAFRKFSARAGAAGGRRARAPPSLRRWERRAGARTGRGGRVRRLRRALLRSSRFSALSRRWASA